MEVLQTSALPLGYVAITRRQALRPVVLSERATGFEPVAFSLARRRSTTEPRPRFSNRTHRIHARTQTRTGDTFIFSEVLYQLSYPGQLVLLLTILGILSEWPRPVKCMRRRVSHRLIDKRAGHGHNQGWEWLCPGGRCGLQNRWPVAHSERRWVRLPSTPVRSRRINRRFRRFIRDRLSRAVASLGADFLIEESSADSADSADFPETECRALCLFQMLPPLGVQEV